VAAGPFTTSADLEFEPLQELLRACEALQGGPPAALLLAGPFLDASHELVANGQLEQPFQRVFEQQASGHLPSCHTKFCEPPPERVAQAGGKHAAGEALSAPLRAAVGNRISSFCASIHVPVVHTECMQ